jgi:hypothetical protein
MLIEIPIATNEKITFFPFFCYYCTGGCTVTFTEVLTIYHRKLLLKNSKRNDKLTGYTWKIFINIKEIVMEE